MDKDFLERLSNARGVSGDEGEVRELLIAAVRDHVDEYRIDSIGNLVTLKRAAGRASRRPSRVLLAAHMDEVGLLVVHADGDGRLRFKPVGGIDNRVLPAQVFLIGPKRVPGVIGMKPIHLTTQAERERVIEADDLTLDIGARSREEALGAVSIGDTAVFASNLTLIGDGLVRGKALDDRAGCAALVELLKGDYPFDLYGVFTAQEEVGSRGARAAAYAIQPEVAFVLETAPSDDGPTEQDRSPVTRVGRGPALTIADRGTVSDKSLVKLLMNTARENNIPLQIKQPLIGGTDAARIHLTREGVPSVSLSIPTRYLHSAEAVLSIQDYDDLVQLMRKALLRLQHGVPA